MGQKTEIGSMGKLIGGMTDEQMKALPIVEVTFLSFTNIHGGTGMTNWDHNTRLSGPVKVRVTKAWEDYETGFRFTGVSGEEKLDKYLDTQAPKDKREVFFGQFQFVGSTSDETAESVVLALAKVCKIARTPDGGSFVCQEDGSWVCTEEPSIVYSSVEDMFGEMDVTFDAKDSIEVTTSE